MRKLHGLGVLAFAVGALFAFPGVARASTGTVLTDIAPPAAIGGAGVAFDGQYLYYTDLNGSVLHRISPSGVDATDVPLLGGVAITTITYDASHDVFWGVDATGLNVYRIEKDGWAGLQFTLIPLLDLPGGCNAFLGCSSTVSGLAYDATDDSLWYLPQGSSRVYHFTSAGQPLDYFDTANVPECPTNGVTGIAAGATSLYLTSGSCGAAFQYSRTGAKQASFPAGTAQASGAACDDKSFADKTALWVRDPGAGKLRAVEVAQGSCPHGGGAAAPDTTTRWMSGSGLGLGTESVITDGGTTPTADTVDVQHAFHLLCDQGGGPPNNMVVNWKDSFGNRFSFHLEKWTPGSCFNDGSSPSPPPCTDPDCFNSMTGTGLGRLTGRGPRGQQLPIGGTCNPSKGDTAHCGTLEPFRVSDRGEPNNRGEPGTRDDGEFGINDPQQGLILFVCACQRANYQAHQRPH